MRRRTAGWTGGRRKSEEEVDPDGSRREADRLRRDPGLLQLTRKILIAIMIRGIRTLNSLGRRAANIVQIPK
jgi:hypothetical protein